jgi:predicted  nucleic acid-binding Zn-ribbon protein
MDKTTFKIKALETIDTMYDEVDKLHQRRDKLNDSLKESYDKSLEDLNRRKTELQEKLKAVENASEENWQQAKDALSKSMEHYKAGFNELKNVFKS